MFLKSPCLCFRKKDWRYVAGTATSIVVFPSAAIPRGRLTEIAGFGIGKSILLKSLQAIWIGWNWFVPLYYAITNLVVAPSFLLNGPCQKIVLISVCFGTVLDSWSSILVL